MFRSSSTLMIAPTARAPFAPSRTLMRAAVTTTTTSASSTAPARRRSSPSSSSSSSSSSSGLHHRQQKHDPHNSPSNIISRSRFSNKQSTTTSSSNSSLAGSLSAAFERVRRDPVARVLLGSIARGHYKCWPHDVRVALFHHRATEEANFSSAVATQTKPKAAAPSSSAAAAVASTRITKNRGTEKKRNHRTRITDNDEEEAVSFSLKHELLQLSPNPRTNPSPALRSFLELCWPHRSVAADRRHNNSNINIMREAASSSKKHGATTTTSSSSSSSSSNDAGHVVRFRQRRHNADDEPCVDESFAFVVHHLRRVEALKTPRPGTELATKTLVQWATETFFLLRSVSVIADRVRRRRTSSSGRGGDGSRWSSLPHATPPPPPPSTSSSSLTVAEEAFLPWLSRGMPVVPSAMRRRFRRNKLNHHHHKLNQHHHDDIDGPVVFPHLLLPHPYHSLDLYGSVMSPVQSQSVLVAIPERYGISSSSSHHQFDCCEMKDDEKEEDSSSGNMMIDTINSSSSSSSAATTSTRHTTTTTTATVQFIDLTRVDEDVGLTAGATSTSRSLVFPNMEEQLTGEDIAPSSSVAANSNSNNNNAESDDYDDGVSEEIFPPRVDAQFNLESFESQFKRAKNAKQRRHIRRMMIEEEEEIDAILGRAGKTRDKQEWMKKLDAVFEAATKNSAVPSPQQQPTNNHHDHHRKLVIDAISKLPLIIGGDVPGEAVIIHRCRQLDDAVNILHDGPSGLPPPTPRRSYRSLSSAALDDVVGEEEGTEERTNDGEGDDDDDDFFDDDGFDMDLDDLPTVSEVDRFLYGGGGDQQASRTLKPDLFYFVSVDTLVQNPETLGQLAVSRLRPGNCRVVVNRTEDPFAYSSSSNVELGRPSSSPSSLLPPTRWYAMSVQHPLMSVHEQATVSDENDAVSKFFFDYKSSADDGAAAAMIHNAAEYKHEFTRTPTGVMPVVAPAKTNKTNNKSSKKMTTVASSSSSSSSSSQKHVDNDEGHDVNVNDGRRLAGPAFAAFQRAMWRRLIAVSHAKGQMPDGAAAFADQVCDRAELRELVSSSGRQPQQLRLQQEGQFWSSSAEDDGDEDANVAGVVASYARLIASADESMSSTSSRRTKKKGKKNTVTK